MSAISDMANVIFKSQSFSQFIGAEIEVTDDGEVTMTIELQPHHKQQHGFAHGGVLSYLADNSLTFAGGIALFGDALTAEFKINYMRPAKGIKLVAVARALSAGKRQAVCCTEISSIDENGKSTLCAYATGTIVKV